MVEAFKKTNWRKINIFKRFVFWMNWKILIESIKTILGWGLGIGFVVLIYLIIYNTNKNIEEERLMSFREAQEDCYEKKGDCEEIFHILYFRLFSEHIDR